MKTRSPDEVRRDHEALCKLAARDGWPDGAVVDLEALELEFGRACEERGCIDLRGLQMTPAAFRRLRAAVERWSDCTYCGGGGWRTEPYLDTDGFCNWRRRPCPYCLRAQ